jgi:hypothetical protein
MQGMLKQVVHIVTTGAYLVTARQATEEEGVSDGKGCHKS